MNKRILSIVFSVVLCVTVLLFLNEVKSFDGYYHSIDSVLAHEEWVQKGAEEIARIKNGSGYVEVMRLDDYLIFYSFKSKNTITGKKYATAHVSTSNIDYDAITGAYPERNEWTTFSKIIFNNKDEQDFYWCVIKKSADTLIESNIMRFEYSYEGNQYYLLGTFESEYVD